MSIQIRSPTLWTQPDVRVCRMIEQGDHLERAGLIEIVDIAYESSLGKRRHDQADLLRALGEVKG
mgnify:CR=1 FL=1